MNLQFVANKKDQDGAESGKDQARRMVTFVGWPGKHVCNRSAND